MLVFKMLHMGFPPTVSVSAMLNLGCENSFVAALNSNRVTPEPVERKREILQGQYRGNLAQYNDHVFSFTPVGGKDNAKGKVVTLLFTHRVIQKMLL
eukprot:3587194-Rhodomonas_salina.1